MSSVVVSLTALQYLSVPHASYRVVSCVSRPSDGQSSVCAFASVQHYHIIHVFHVNWLCNGEGAV